MKVYKISLIVSGCISLISIVLAIICHYIDSCNEEFVSSLFLGMFASGILVVATSCGGYFSEKSKLRQNICMTASRLSIFSILANYITKTDDGRFKVEHKIFIPIVKKETENFEILMDFICEYYKSLFFSKKKLKEIICIDCQGVYELLLSTPQKYVDMNKNEMMEILENIDEEELACCKKVISYFSKQHKQGEPNNG